MSRVQFTSGYAALVEGVKTFFLEQDVTAEVVVGYLEPGKQLNQGPGGANRVVFLPGDANGAAGKITPPRDVGDREIADPEAPDYIVARTRCLLTWERQFTICIWAHDDSNPRDALAQLVAAEALFERVAQGVEHVYRASGVNASWGSVAWMPMKENTRGAELRVGLALIHPLFDVPDDYAHPANPGFTLDKEGSDE